MTDPSVAGWPALDLRRQPLWANTYVTVSMLLVLLIVGVGVPAATWLPGRAAGCLTLPGSPVTRLAALEWADRVTADGSVSGHECIGWTAVADVRFSGGGVPFGTDRGSLCYQDRILRQNEQWGDAARLTVVLMTSFRDDGSTGQSHPPAAEWRLPPGEPCPVATDADPSTSPSETEELQALLLAAKVSPDLIDSPTHLRMVVANTGNRSTHADRVAELLAGLRGHVTGPIVVVMSGDSRTASQAAIRRLTAAGLLVVAPTLTADGPGPGRAFVDDERYLQLSPSNRSEAQTAVDLLRRRGTRALYVYREPDTGPDVDLYTQSLADDVAEIFAASGGQVTRLAGAADVRANATAGALCAGPTASGGPATRALFYAERWDRFDRHNGGNGFAQVLDGACATQGGPVPVLAGDSMSRFMNNDPRRRTTGVTWPIGWFRKGVQCSDLLADVSSTATDSRRRAAAATLLAQVQANLGACRPATGPTDATDRTERIDSPVQLGERVPLTWDAVLLGVALAQPGAAAGAATVAGTVDTYSTGSGVVAHRSLTPLCVLSVSAGDRSVAACDRIFGAPA